jgi:hypothetical protein
MTLSKVTRGVADLATLLALVIACAHAAVAGEKLVGTYGEERALLRFKVPGATVLGLLARPGHLFRKREPRTITTTR